MGKRVTVYTKSGEAVYLSEKAAARGVKHGFYLSTDPRAPKDPFASDAKPGTAKKAAGKGNDRFMRLIRDTQAKAAESPLSRPILETEVTDDGKKVHSRPKPYYNAKGEPLVRDLASGQMVHPDGRAATGWSVGLTDEATAKRKGMVAKSTPKTEAKAQTTPKGRKPGADRPKAYNPLPKPKPTKNVLEEWWKDDSGTAVAEARNALVRGEISYGDYHKAVQRSRTPKAVWESSYEMTSPTAIRAALEKEAREAAQDKAMRDELEAKAIEKKTEGFWNKLGLGALDVAMNVLTPIGAVGAVHDFFSDDEHDWNLNAYNVFLGSPVDRMTDEEKRKGIADVDAQLEDLKERRERLKEESAPVIQDYGRYETALGFARVDTGADAGIFKEKDWTKVKTERDALVAALDDLDDEERRLHAVRDAYEGKGNGFFAGVKNTVKDPKYYTLGMVDASNAIAKVRAVKKGIRVQDVAESTAKADEAAKWEDSVSTRAYRSGQITADMLPFMVEVGLSGVSGGTSLAGAAGSGSRMLGRMAARGAAKLLAKKGAKIAAEEAAAAVSRSILRATGKKVVHALGEAANFAVKGAVKGAYTTATFGAGETAANIAKRYLGEAKAVDEKGTKYEFVGGAPVWEAAAKGVLSSWVENYTEELGAGFGAIAKLPAKVFSKGAKAIGLKGLSHAIERFGVKGVSGSLNRIMEKGGFHGIVGESMEEEAGIALHALFGDGDAEWSDFTNGRQQLDIWGGMMLSAGLLQSVQQPGNIRSYRRLRQAESMGKAMLGAERWKEISHTLDEAENENFTEVLSDVLNDPLLTERQKGAVFQYGSRLLRWRGGNLGMLSQGEESSASANGTSESSASEPTAEARARELLDAAEEEGYDSAAPDDRKAALRGLSAASAQATAATGLSNDDLLAMFDPDGQGGDYVSRISTLSEEGKYSDAQLESLVRYAGARRRYEGMLNGIRDDIEGQRQALEANLRDSAHREDGKLYRAEVRRGKGTLPVHVVSGRLAVDGNGRIDRRQSDSRVFVRHEDGKLEMLPPEAFASAEAPLDLERTIAEASETLQQRLAEEAETELESPSDEGAAAGSSVSETENAPSVASSEGTGTSTADASQTGAETTAAPTAAEAEGAAESAETSAETASSQEVRPFRVGDHVWIHVQGRGVLEFEISVGENLAGEVILKHGNQTFPFKVSDLLPNLRAHRTALEMEESRYEEEEMQEQDAADAAEGESGADVSAAPVSEAQEESEAEAEKTDESISADAPSSSTAQQFTDDPALLTAAKAVEDFENPKLPVSAHNSENAAELEKVNTVFNAQLDAFTAERADDFIFLLGMPSPILISAGVAPNSMKLYGNKLLRKMKKHGFRASDLRNLPKALWNPIAVFDNYNDPSVRSVLTSLSTKDGNVLVALSLGKGVDVDVNLVRSAFGKRHSAVVDWFNERKARYIDKEKALDYLYLSAPIAVTSDNQALSSDANVAERNELPKPSEENVDEVPESTGVSTEGEAEVSAAKTGVNATKTPINAAKTRVSAEKTGVSAAEIYAALDNGDLSELTPEAVVAALESDADLSTEDSDALVSDYLATAQNELSKLQRATVKPKKGEGIVAFKERKAAHVAALSDAEARVRFWETVQQLRHEAFSDAKTEARASEEEESVSESVQESRNEANTETSPFGEIYRQFKGKAREAISFLLRKKSGNAKAALHHPEVGYIDLVWGNEKAGLAKIARKHPEVLDDLQGIIDQLHVAAQSDNRIVLENNTHKAVVSKMLGKEKMPQWLLTAYEKRSPTGETSDIVPEPNSHGKQNGTAPLQEGASEHKDNTSSSSAQTEGEEAAPGVGDGVTTAREEGVPVAPSWATAPKSVGLSDEYVAPDGLRVMGHYVLTESGAAVPSHDARRGFVQSEGFPTDERGNTLNDRDYEFDADAQRIQREIARRYDGRAAQQPVVVSPEGYVLSGNGRTMSGDLAALERTDGIYNAYIRDHAAKWGFTPDQISALAHPRIVFELDTPLPLTTETFASFNAQDTKTLSRTEHTVKMGKSVSDDAFGKILRLVTEGHDTLGDFYNDTSAAVAALNVLEESGVTTPQDRANLMDGHVLSDEGRNLLENVMLGKAFTGRPEVIRQLSEVRTLRTSVLTALHSIVNNERLDEDYRLSDALSRAINLVYQARKSGGYKFGDKVRSFVRQTMLFEDVTDVTFKDATVLLLADALNDKHSTLVKRILRSYNERAHDAGTGQLAMFGEALPDRDELLVQTMEALGLLDAGYSDVLHGIESQTTSTDQDNESRKPRKRTLQRKGAQGSDEADEGTVGTPEAELASGSVSGSLGGDGGIAESAAKTGRGSIREERVGDVETQARDQAYADAVARGDMETAERMLAEEAERKGYSPESPYQGESAFNGKAPSENGYYNTLEERKEAYEDGDFEGDWSLSDEFVHGIDMGGLVDWRLSDNELRRADEKTRASILNLRQALHRVRSGEKDVTITMYRSVPAGVTESLFRNGDWITPSRLYAEDNAYVHEGYEGEHQESWNGGYRIIAQEVPLEDVWWDGNDVNEWGYDNGNSEAYKNTANNRKSYGVTYDDAGNLIPLSKRFDDRNSDIRYSKGDVSLRIVENSQDGNLRVTSLSSEAEVPVVGGMEHSVSFEEAITAISSLPNSIETHDGVTLSINKRTRNKLKTNLYNNALPNKEAYRRVVSNLPSVVSGSVLIEEHSDRIKVNGERRAENAGSSGVSKVQRFYGAVSIGDHFYRVKTTAIVRTVDGSSRAHNMEVTKIELLPYISTADASTSVAKEYNSISLAKLLHGVEFSYEKGRKITDELRQNDLSEQRAADEKALSGVPQEQVALRNGLVDVMRDAGLDVSVSDAEGQRVLDLARGVESDAVREERELEAVNAAFNEQLQAQLNGTQDKGHVYDLGMPGAFLRSAGVENLPMHLTANRLREKSSKEYRRKHPFELSDVANLPKALAAPIAVFNSHTQQGTKVVLTELEDAKGNNFVVAIRVARSADSQSLDVEVNSVRSIYPKDYVQGIVDWINRGGLAAVDKEKAIRWIDKQQSYSADVANPTDSSRESPSHLSSASYNSQQEIDHQDLSRAAKIVEGFENPKLSGENVRDQRVWHGSPHDFDAFDHSKMGTGAGAQAYGWGTYVSESETTGRAYLGEQGALYDVEIPDDNGRNYLHYDEAVSPREWTRIRTALLDRLLNEPDEDGEFPYRGVSREQVSRDFGLDLASEDGRTAYGTVSSVLGSDRLASSFFHDLGYAGLRYTSDEVNDYVIFDEGDMEIKDKVKLFRGSHGEVRGFAVDGKIYLDPKLATAETAIHEYTHLWADALRRVNSEEWENVKGLLRESGVWEETAALYPELKDDEDALADEVLAQYSGRRGAERLEAARAEALRDAKGVFDTARVVTVFENVRQALRRFWHGVADFLGLHFTSAEEVADQVLSDLLHGVNPNMIGAEASAEGQVRSQAEELERVNAAFNEKLSGFTEENANHTTFDLGHPSETLRAAGLQDRSMRLYGSKLLKKIRKHGFDKDVLYDLPRAVAHPIAVFNNYGEVGNRSVLTELHTAQGNVLVAIGLGKGSDVDFNIVRRTFGKGSHGVIDWINKGALTYVDKEKALNYLHSAAPIAAATGNQELSSAAKIVEGFENPKLEAEKLKEKLREQRLHDPIGGSGPVLDGLNSGTLRSETLSEIKEAYDQEVKRRKNQLIEGWQDNMLSLKLFQNMLAKASGIPIADHENAYWAENRMSSTNEAEQSQFRSRHFRPLLEAVSDLQKAGVELDKIYDYLLVRHGMERNLVLAFRDAVEALPRLTGESAASHARRKQRLWERYNTDPTVAENRRLYAEGKKTWSEYIYADDIARDLIAGAAYRAHRKHDYSGVGGIYAIDDDNDKRDHSANEAKALAEADAMERKHGALTRALLDRIRSATRSTLDKQYESGLLRPGAYRHLQSMFDCYLPLRGFDEDIAEDHYTYVGRGRGGIRAGAALQRAKGRNSKADNPLGYLLAQADSAIVEGNRNLMKQHFLRMVEHRRSDLVAQDELYLHHDPVTDRWEPVFPEINADDSSEQAAAKVSAFRARMAELVRTDPDYRRQSDVPDIGYRLTTGSLSEHQIVVYVNGRPTVLTITGDPRVAQAVNGRLNPESSRNAAARALYTLRNFIARNATQYNPGFVLRNMSRDFDYASERMIIREGWKAAAEFSGQWALNTVKVARLLHQWQHGQLDTRTEDGRLFHEFMMNGGETGTTHIFSVEEYQRDAKKLLAKLSRSRFNPRSIVDALEEMGDGLGLLARISEDVTRFTAYAYYRRRGASIARAVNEAKEISTNFNRKGAGTKAARSKDPWYISWALGLADFTRAAYAFQNANIQGFANQVRLLRENPLRALKSITRILLKGMALPMLNVWLCSLYGGDDDDYYDLPEYVRRNNYCLYVPKVGWLKIPAGFGNRSVYAVGELLYGQLSGATDYTDKELAESMLGIVSDLIPVEAGKYSGNGTVSALNAIPTIFRPVAEIGVNKDWQGRPIYNDKLNERLPAFRRGGRYTAPWMVDATRKLNAWTGGDDYTKGWVNLNPSMVEHLGKGALSGLGTTLGYAGETLGTLYDQVKGDPATLNWAHVPIAGDFYMPPGSYKESGTARAFSREREKFETLKLRLTGYYKDLSEGKLDPERAARLTNFTTYDPAFKEFLLFAPYISAENRYRQAIKAADPETAERLEAERNALMKEALERAKALREEAQHGQGNE